MAGHADVAAAPDTTKTEFVCIVRPIARATTPMAVRFGYRVSHHAQQQPGPGPSSNSALSRGTRSLRSGSSRRIIGCNEPGGEQLQRLLKSARLFYDGLLLQRPDFIFAYSPVGQAAGENRARKPRGPVTEGRTAKIAACRLQRAARNEHAPRAIAGWIGRLPAKVSTGETQASSRSKIAHHSRCEREAEYRVRSGACGRASTSGLR